MTLFKSISFHLVLTPLLSHVRCIMTKRPVIIDTDAGVDDAVALLMAFKAHKAGEIDIKAITTVSGNTEVDNVNVNVFRILEVMGLEKEIPVFSGAKTTFSEKSFSTQPRYCGIDGFYDTHFETTLPVKSLISDETASDAILRLTSALQGQMSLLAMAPLTNIAKALVQYEKTQNIEPMFEKTLIMGGNMEASSDPELNFLMDPEAAQKILGSNLLGEMKLLPFEACEEQQGILKGLKERKLNPAVELMLKLRQDEMWPVYDQLLVAYLLDESVVTQTENIKVSINLGAPKELRGKMEANETGSELVLLTSVDKIKAKKLMFNYLT